MSKRMEGVNILIVFPLVDDLKKLICYSARAQK